MPRNPKIFKSHKTRLCFFSFISTLALLAVVFGGAVIGFRYQLIQDEFHKIHAAIRTQTIEKEFDLGDFHDNYPDLTAAIFDRNGNKIQQIGSLPLAFTKVRLKANDIVENSAFYNGKYLVVGSDWKLDELLLKKLLLFLALLIVPLSALSGVATYWWANSIFEPLKEMTAKAESFSEGEAHYRLDESDPGEFGDLAKRINAVLERLSNARRREAEFASDAAHELRTPIAILRTRLEVALLRQRSETEYEAVIKKSLAETERLTGIAEALLLSARGNPLPDGVTQLRELEQVVTDRWSDAAAKRKVSLLTKFDDGVIPIAQPFLEIAINNLISNGIRFSPEGGKLQVTAAIKAVSGPEQTFTLTVTDDGPGVPEAERETVFERWYRGDSARNRDSGGAGIGLSLCRSIISAAGGSVAYDDSATSGGAFKIEFKFNQETSYPGGDA